MMTFKSMPYTGSRLDASIELGQQIADKWGTHALIIQMSRDIAKKWNTHGRMDEARAIQTWINRRVKYVPDPHAAEMMSEPLTTLQNGGDCDDQAILAAALLQSIGHDARIGAVTWKGRAAASHAVAVDLTAGCIVDPISVSPDAWPPLGYAVESIKFRDKAGQMQSMNGLFSKLIKAVAKPFQKIFPAKTVLGKIMDPLGLTDPKRNLNLVGRVADVVGTAAAVVAGGWAIGAASAGTAGGFWTTAGAGASAVGSGLGSTAAWAGKAIAPALLASMISGGGRAPTQAQASGLTPDQLAAWNAYNGTTGDPGMYAGPAYSGGGGGGGAYTLPDGNPLVTPGSMGNDATNYSPLLLLGAAALGVVLLTKKPTRKAAHV